MTTMRITARAAPNGSGVVTFIDNVRAMRCAAKSRGQKWARTPSDPSSQEFILSRRRRRRGRKALFILFRYMEYGGSRAVEMRRIRSNTWIFEYPNL
jgi:hypothetical protein